MKNIIRWFILNTVAANLLMVFIIIAGIFTLSRLRMEVFPDITIPIINVSVVYPGASPEDIEESIIEENVIRQTVMPSHLRTGRFISKPLRNMTSKVVTQTQNLVRMNPPGNFRARNYKVNSTCGSTRRGKSTVPKNSY